MTWHLPKDRVDLEPNLDATTLDRKVSAFFAGALPDETLLFYFAGHGDREGNEGFLLPVDHVPGKKEGRLSASALWAMIEASPAERVVVILDACRAGAFLFPESLAGRIDGSSKAVAFLSSTSASTTTPDTTAGGPFTQALAGALKLVKNIDASVGAVTLGKAFYAAAGESGARARIGGTLDNLQLAWPRDPGATPTPVALKTQDVTGTGAANLSVALESTRLGIAQGTLKGTRGGPRTLEMQATFRRDAAWIRVDVYSLEELKRAEIEALWPSLTGPRFKKGQRVQLVLPVREGLPPGTYHVRVERCALGGVCGAETPATFDVEL